ncbi:MAG: Type 1 glutamine amidotransferase-like domain-containing protein [Pseudomonadales bacterium]|nr:Type 1 glutamine amidotransferase-like domain-containing protein [Pseudomonadales bacterium]
MKYDGRLTNNLILIGGGIMLRGETERIDRWMLRRVQNNNKKSKPKVLFIPSASGDLDEYIKNFTNRYQEYGAIVSSLSLTSKAPSKTKIKEQFFDAELIYFGGGSAGLLLEAFKKFELERLCFEANKLGILITGLSAGAIIWGEKFLTFDRKGDDFINFRIKRGLGWTNSLIIPHFDPSMLKNKNVLKLLKQNLNLKSLAIGNGTAVYWEGSSIPLLRNKKNHARDCFYL